MDFIHLAHFPLQLPDRLLPQKRANLHRVRRSLHNNQHRRSDITVLDVLHFESDSGRDDLHFGDLLGCFWELLCFAVVFLRSSDRGDCEDVLCLLEQVQPGFVLHDGSQLFLFQVLVRVARLDFNFSQ